MKSPTLNGLVSRICSPLATEAMLFFSARATPTPRPDMAPMITFMETPSWSRATITPRIRMVMDRNEPRNVTIPLFRDFPAALSQNRFTRSEITQATTTSASASARTWNVS